MTVIGIIGGAHPSEEHYRKARVLGRLIGVRGWDIVCGGLTGVMEAACQGAKEAGGRTIGILPGDDPKAANPYVDIAIPTGMGIARNVLIVRTADAVVAVDGAEGTLSEMAVSLNLGKPLVVLDGIRLDRLDQFRAYNGQRMTFVETPEAALEMLEKIVEKGD